MPNFSVEIAVEFLDSTLLLLESQRLTDLQRRQVGY